MSDLHFEVEGPGRDYDFTTFCKRCWSEALSWANEWMEESADAAEVGKSVSITLHIRHGEPDYCYACKQAKEGGDGHV